MELRKLIDKKGRFSKEEIDFIIAEGAKVGVKPPKKTKCQNCWRDMAIEILYVQRAADPNRPKSPRRFRDGSDAERHGVVFMGRTITNDNIGENWDWMTENGFPRQLLANDEG